MLIAAGLICGFTFGWGLLISGMVQPAKVLAFLDLFGFWDPSLAVVMMAALLVSSLGFAVAKRRDDPSLHHRATGQAGPTSTVRWLSAQYCLVQDGAWLDCSGPLWRISPPSHRV